MELPIVEYETAKLAKEKLNFLFSFLFTIFIVNMIIWEKQI